MKKSKQSCDLHSCFLCNNVLPDWLPALASNRSNRFFKKGELIVEEGSAITGVYFIFHGKVKIHKDWGEFKELIVRFASSGEMIGSSALCGDMIHPASVTAIEPCNLCFIELAFFENTLKVNPQFLFSLSRRFAFELKEAETRMRNLAHMPVKGRIAQSLMALQEKFGQSSEGFINVNLSRQDLASFAGTTYETVFRIMNELIDDQILQVAGKTIYIRDMHRLAMLTQELSMQHHQVQQSKIAS
jgi:CRP/FNR family transcriptional regulator, cyclic AMP receptor protein